MYLDRRQGFVCSIRSSVLLCFFILRGSSVLRMESETHVLLRKSVQNIVLKDCIALC